MTKSREQKRDFHWRNGAIIGRDVVFSYLCPKKSLCSENGALVLEKGSGFSNPYRHLKSCLTGGDEQALLSIYKTAAKESWSQEHLLRPPT